MVDGDSVVTGKCTDIDECRQGDLCDPLVKCINIPKDQDITQDFMYAVPEGFCGRWKSCAWRLLSSRARLGRRATIGTLNLNANDCIRC